MEANRPKRARRERSSKPLAIAMWKSEHGLQQARSNASKESKGLMESPCAPRMKDKVIRSGKPK